MNKTISHSSGRELFSERLRDKQQKHATRQTSLADVKRLAKEA
jgi:hypothetical protein